MDMYMYSWSFVLSFCWLITGYAMGCLQPVVYMPWIKQRQRRQQLTVFLLHASSQTHFVVVFVHRYDHRTVQLKRSLQMWDLKMLRPQHQLRKTPLLVPQQNLALWRNHQQSQVRMVPLKRVRCFVLFFTYNCVSHKWLIWTMISGFSGFFHSNKKWAHYVLDLSCRVWSK